MKKAKRDGGAGLQEWLSYQSRPRAVAGRKSGAVDWDEGIEVQEERLPRELCEQRLREEAGRKVTPAAYCVPAQNVTPVVEVEDVSFVCTPPAHTIAAQKEGFAASAIAGSNSTIELRARIVRELNICGSKSKPPAPAQLETSDLANALPAFDR